MRLIIKGLVKYVQCINHLPLFSGVYSLRRLNFKGSSFFTSQTNMAASSFKDFGPLVGAIDQGTSSSRFLVSHHSETQILEDCFSISWHLGWFGYHFRDRFGIWTPFCVMSREKVLQNVIKTDHLVYFDYDELRLPLVLAKCWFWALPWLYKSIRSARWQWNTIFWQNIKSKTWFRLALLPFYFQS